MARRGIYDSNAQLDIISQAFLRKQEEAEAMSLKKRSKDYMEELKKKYADTEVVEKKYQEWRRKEEIASEKSLLEAKERLRKESLDILAIYEKNLWLTADKDQRAQITKSRIQRETDVRKEFQTRLLQEKALRKTINQLETDLKQSQNDADKTRLTEQIEALQKEAADQSEWLNQNQETFNNSAKHMLSYLEELKANGSAEDLQEAANVLKDMAKDSSRTEEERQALIQQTHAAEVEARKKEAQEKNDAIKKELKYRLTTFDGIKDTIEDGLLLAVKGLGKMFDSFDQPINTFFEYQAKYQARMQGSDNDYQDMMSNISKTIGISPFLKQTKMVENLQTLIETGTNYNLELRAYIATVSENIASTFNAFDSNLLRLIRIQASDSTAARLGMESALTSFLNDMFQDSTYLQDVSDQVSAALLDASAQLSREGAAEMEYVAQKWLGSLYSLGVSGEAVQNIATGLGYIGSGNIEALTSDEALMNLFTMGASKGGTSITQMLTGGLTAEKTNNLLAGITDYLAEIATNTDSNNVTKSAMAQIFGVTNTDLRSIANLNSESFDTIYKSNLNYTDALNEASSQIKQISNRTHISAMVNNIIDNASTSAALNIGGNTGLYTMYKALNIVSGLVGDRGLEIPGIQALGTGTASGIDVLSIMKAGITGFSLLGSLVGSIGNLNNRGLPTLSTWDYEERMSRGSDISYSYTGMDSGFSKNVVYDNKGSSASSDMRAAAMDEAISSATENQSAEDMEVAEVAETFYKEGREYLQILADTITSMKVQTDAASLRVTVTNDVPVVMKDSPSVLQTQLVGMSNDTQVLLARLIKAGLLGKNLTTSLIEEPLSDEGSIFDELRYKLNGLTVEINNDTFNPIPIIASGGT